MTGNGKNRPAPIFGAGIPRRGTLNYWRSSIYSQILTSRGAVVSESPSATAQEQGTNKPAGGSPIRLVVRVILFGILLYLICALPYDYFVARAGQVKAWEKLYNKRAEQSDPEYKENETPGLLQRKNEGSGDVETTNETVAETLGRKPSKSTSENGVTTEVYTWRAGLPWKTYNIYVVYAERKNKKPRLENAFLNEAPSDLSVQSESENSPDDENATPGAPESPAGAVPIPMRPSGGGRPAGADEAKPSGQDSKRPAAEDEPAKPDIKKESAASAPKDSDKKSDEAPAESKP